jgi:hypothetical protein
MSHESVWYSRPRTYGKGARSWYALSSSAMWKGWDMDDVGLLEDEKEARRLSDENIHGEIRTG